MTDGRRAVRTIRDCRIASVAVACARRVALRLVIGGLLAAAALSADAVVFTKDYDRVTVLPALTNGGPASQDWRQHGAVTPVKNAGQCDASWAFGVTGLVEGDHFIRVGTLRSLSEQELLDCTGSGSGCRGGSPIDALRTVIAKGLASEPAYPYTARAGVCRPITAMATIPGAGRVPPGDEVSLKSYVAQGPVLALVDAGQPSFDLYHGGVYSDPACRADKPTLAVLIVGYGTMGGQDYWIVKNSFGSPWGAAGYIFMSRNNNNNCGIASFALAVSDDPLPPPSVPAIPMLSPWALGLLLLGFAALGFAILRRHTD